MRLTLEQCFGDGAYQDESVLVIPKSRLAEIGLMPSTTNSAESLLAAILLLIWRNFEGEVSTPGGSLLDPLGAPITYDNSALYLVLGIRFWRTVFMDPSLRRAIFILDLRTDPETYGLPINPNL